MFPVILQQVTRDNQGVIVIGQPTQTGRPSRKNLFRDPLPDDEAPIATSLHPVDARFEGRRLPKEAARSAESNLGDQFPPRVKVSFIRFIDDQRSLDRQGPNDRSKVPEVWLVDYVMVRQIDTPVER